MLEVAGAAMEGGGCEAAAEVSEGSHGYWCCFVAPPLDAHLGQSRQISAPRRASRTAAARAPTSRPQLRTPRPSPSLERGTRACLHEGSRRAPGRRLEHHRCREERAADGGGPLGCAHAAAACAQPLGEAKVAKLDVARAVKKQVLRLEVAVHDAALVVQVAEHVGDARGVEAGVVLVEAPEHVDQRKELAAEGLLITPFRVTRRCAQGEAC